MNVKVLPSLLILLLLGSDTTRTPAQISDLDGIAAIQQVMCFRMAWLANDAPFEICGIAESLRDDGDLIENFDPWARHMLVRSGNCAGFEQVELLTDQKEVVGVKSMVIDDSSATVHLYVRVPSYTHHEVYELVRRGPPGTIWRVLHVRIEPGLAI